MCKVSVIIPYYNNQDTLERALASVKAQTFSAYELVLVDDGSQDGSNAAADSFAARNPMLDITILHQPNMGPSHARNAGIKAAAGEYIAFLDADDEWLPEKLMIQVEQMEKGDVDMVSCSYHIIKDGICSEFFFTEKTLKRTSFRELLFKHYYATPCVIVKKTVLVDIGMFPEEQRYMEDAFLFASIARKYNAFVTRDQLVNIYKLPYGDAGLSSRLHDMEKYELLNLVRFYKENKNYEYKVDVPTILAAGIFSVLKYIRRRILVFLRNPR